MIKKLKLKDLKKRQKLFVTDDGKEIYKGDWYWYVMSYLNYGNTKAPHEYIGDQEEIARFSTKEKAEEYIEEHKPRYSESDIREAFKKVKRSPRNAGSAVNNWIGQIQNQFLDILHYE